MIAIVTNVRIMFTEVYFVPYLWCR